MQVIISHVNTDFDAFASLLAAKKLYPEATIVLSDKQNDQVKRFLNIYRDTFSFVRDRDIDWEKVDELIMVDVASLRRIGTYASKLPRESVHITVYDHHPPREGDVEADVAIIEDVGATITLLVEEIKRRSLPVDSFEATIFGLGLYTDTGNFTYQTTTVRDFDVVKFLMEKGMNLEMVQRFSEQSLVEEQQVLLDELFVRCESQEIDGLEYVFTTYEQDTFQGGLALLTEKLLDMKGADAMIAIVKMKRHVYIVGRARADRINLQPLLKKFGGGGHQHAGSATVKRSELDEVVNQVKQSIDLTLQPAVTAKDLMASPVKTLTPDTTIEEAGKLMYRYGHSGYPIVAEDKLVGIITRRDLDKANHHGLGHAPVKAYMTTNIITIEPETTLEEIQNIVIENNIGRLPVVEGEKVVGIVTRTNIIEKIHEQALDVEQNGTVNELKDNIAEEMKRQLPEEILTILQQVSKTATEIDEEVYLIGGIVRDILLERKNDDIDLVVEGNAIHLARQLQQRYGGALTTHEDFGTATWTHPSNLEVDLASSRLEYYERPASLPDVEGSTLQEDLYRRDFTINAMAIALHENHFGKLVDPFSGQNDLYKRSIKVLHNLSFVEDPTRILRAVRFEIRFGFRMDEQTESLALHSIEQMKEVSAKRIIDEVKRMFIEENVYNSIKRLYELKFWQQYTNNRASSKLALRYVRKLQSLLDKHSNLPKTSKWFLYFMVPFYVANSIDAIGPFLLTKKKRKLYESIKEIEHLTFEQYKTIGELQLALKNISDEAIIFALTMMNLEDEDRILKYVKKRRSLRPLLTGEDLKRHNVQPGPIYKDILLALEVSMLNEQVTTKEEAEKWLQDYIRTM